MDKEGIEVVMAGYDLPIRDNNEREWYANVGRIQERERIIKLLEGLIETRPEDWEDAYRGYSFERLIELIKGETNE